MDSRYTLKKNSDFRRLYSKGKSAVTPYLVVYCRRNGQAVNRVGFTVSAKLGNAVTRNRVRRQLREIYRLNSAYLKNGIDMIIVARSLSLRAANLVLLLRRNANEENSDCLHPVLSEIHLPCPTGMLSFYSHLLTICVGSHRKIRCSEGRMACSETHLPLSPLPRA